MSGPPLLGDRQRALWPRRVGAADTHNARFKEGIGETESPVALEVTTSGGGTQRSSLTSHNPATERYVTSQLVVAGAGGCDLTAWFTCGRSAPQAADHFGIVHVRQARNLTPAAPSGATCVRQRR